MTIVVGVGLFVASWLVPSMRWTANDAHESAGSARVFLGSGWTLTDGGFPASDLIPVIAVVAVVVGLGSLLVPPPARWWIQLGSVALMAVYVLWVLYVFARKLEDVVFPSEGVALALAALVVTSVGLWRSRESRLPGTVTDGVG
jgi:hypothetical protein